MTGRPNAFRASYADLKLIKTRQCVQIVFELPLADFDAAYEVLGGLPDNSKEIWFAIAPLNLGKEAMPHQPLSGLDNAKPQSSAAAAGAKRDWRDMQPQKQAGIRCNDPPFWAFLNETRGFTIENPNDAAIVVRNLCGVNSRSELANNHKARVLWHQLDEEFLAWRLVSA